MRFASQTTSAAPGRVPGVPRVTPVEVRELWASETGRSTERWQQLAIGVVGLTVPDDVGGLGLGEVELVLLLEEAGMHCSPSRSARLPWRCRSC